MSDRRNGMTFEEWQRQVNRVLAKRIGLTADDLPDCAYWDMWNDETTPDDAAVEVLDNAGYNDEVD